MALSLLNLPVELQRAILLHLDGISLAAVCDTCECLRAVANDAELWMKLVCARYRVSRRVIQSRRLQASGGVSWKTLYVQWDSCQRMPMSRISGPSFPAIAKHRYRNALMWCTVYSSDDCRLINGKTLRLRLVVQNIDPSEALVVKPRETRIYTHNNEAREFEIKQVVVERNSGKKETTGKDDIPEDGIRLNRDEFAVVRLLVKMGGDDVHFEIDALEQLSEIHLPITQTNSNLYSSSNNNRNTSYKGPSLVRGPLLLDYINNHRSTTLKAEFRQKTIVDMYTFVSGFWLRQ